MAKTATTTKFNVSAIMQKAWAEYRKTAAMRRLTKFDRSAFTYELQLAWAGARRDAQIVEPVVVAEPVKLAPAVQVRADEIRGELTWMEMGNFIDWPRHRELSVELFSLAA